MRIAIPTNGKKGLDDTVAQHFGRSQTYTILDENGKIVEIIDNTAEHTESGKVPPELLKDHGTNIILCRDLGFRALNICNHLGMDVYISYSETVKDVFDEWKSGKLWRYHRIST